MVRYFIRMFSLAAAVIAFWYLTRQGSAVFSERPFWTFRHGINLAYLGTFFSLLSAVYMLRKYRIVTFGKIRTWLDIHVFLGTVGLFLVFMHTQYEFGAMVPAYAAWSMIIIGISGLFGWHLFLTSARTLLDDVALLTEKDEIIFSTVTSSAFKFWHDIHYIFSLSALVLTIAHTASIFLFRGRW